MNDTRTRRSHNRVLLECYLAIKKASDGNDPDKLVKVMSRYGRSTVNEACEMLKEDAAERLGMTKEQFEESLKEDN